MSPGGIPVVNKQKICIRQHELSQQPVVLEVRSGQTILQMLQEVLVLGGQPGADLADDIVVKIEGREVPRKLWAHVRPRIGKHVHAYRTAALQGGSVKKIIGAVVMIAVAWWAGAAIGAIAEGATVFGLSNFAAYAAVGATYMLGSNTVPSLIIPRPQ
jgi:hypothetical protein